MKQIPFSNATASDVIDILHEQGLPATQPIYFVQAYNQDDSESYIAMAHSETLAPAFVILSPSLTLTYADRSARADGIIFAP